MLGALGGVGVSGQCKAAPRQRPAQTRPEKKTFGGPGIGAGLLRLAHPLAEETFKTGQVFSTSRLSSRLQRLEKTVGTGWRFIVEKCLLKKARGVERRRRMASRGLVGCVGATRLLVKPQVGGAISAQQFAVAEKLTLVFVESWFGRNQSGNCWCSRSPAFGKAQALAGQNNRISLNRSP